MKSNSDTSMHDAATRDGTAPGQHGIAASGSNPTTLPPSDVVAHLGRLTRALHETLTSLGYDKKIENAAQQLPDVRERLAHIANLTWLAAERVLSAVEESQNLQQEVQREATSLLERWQGNMHFGGGAGNNGELAEDTCAFLDRAIVLSTTQHDLLQDIMMAQDFQDLTGQIIKRLGGLAQDLEENLVQLLIQTAPQAPGGKSEPAVPVSPKADRVHSQAEVDLLLESLGF